MAQTEKVLSFNMHTAAYADEDKIKNMYLDGESGRQKATCYDWAVLLQIASIAASSKSCAISAPCWASWASSSSCFI